MVAGNGRQARGQLQGSPRARGQQGKNMPASVKQLLMVVEADGPFVKGSSHLQGQR